MNPPPGPHYRHLLPAESISHAVWLYHVFSLSLRDIELLLAVRGVVVSYETVRRWCEKFGQTFANCQRRRRPRPGDKWHLDEVFIRIRGVQRYLWRAVDQDGGVLGRLAQPRWDGNAAKRFFRRLLKGLQYVPRVIVTDKLRSLRRSTTSPPSQGRTPTKPIFEQSRGELTSADTASGTPDATVQIAGTGLGLPLPSRVYPWPLPSPPTPNPRAIRSWAVNIWRQETRAQHVA